MYSKSKLALFYKLALCYILLCKLYSSSDQALASHGFTDWKNFFCHLSWHDTSSIHRESVCLHSNRLHHSSPIGYYVVQ